jgi:hypothetical protein
MPAKVIATLMANELVIAPVQQAQRLASARSVQSRAMASRRLRGRMSVQFYST